MLFSILFFVFLLFLIGCAPETVQCPECPSRIQVCQTCNYPEMGCVDVDDVNKIINLTNQLLETYNINTQGEPIALLRYYSKVKGGP